MIKVFFIFLYQIKKYYKKTIPDIRELTFPPKSGISKSNKYYE